MSVCTTFAFATGANDDPSGATVMALNGSGTGSVNYIDDPVDWWVVNASGGGDLRFNLVVPPGQDFDLEIYDYTAPSGFLGGSYGVSGYDEEVTITMFYSGPYYAKVYTYGQSYGDYTISNQVINNLPNLTTDYTPSGWDYPIVPSSVQGTNIVNTLYANQPTYIDWAVANLTDISINDLFYVYLYVDGQLAASWYFSNGLESHHYGYVLDYQDIFTSGNHTLKIVVDPTNLINESDESTADNTYERQFYWNPPPNNSPTLSNGYVTPASGSVLTNFTYYVTYTDPDGDAPDIKDVQIDGSGGELSHDMTYVSGNYTTGAVFKYETTLSIGEHSFNFYFTDGQGGSAETAVVNEPLVVNMPPEVTIVSPNNNDIVSGIVTILVDGYELEDGVISTIEYYIDDILKYIDNSPVPGSPTSQWDWDTSSYLYGSHTIKVVGWDSMGGWGADEIDVIVDNGDYIDISHIPVPAVMGDTVTFYGHVTSGVNANRTIYIYSEEAALSDSVITDSNGDFIYQWTPVNLGTYYFQFGFAENACTFGDAFTVTTVLPGINEIVSVDFTPLSGSTVQQGENMNLDVSVGIETGNPGVLQVWITGNGISKEEWTYIDSPQSTVRQFNFSITAPLLTGAFAYNVYTQFQPNASPGPLASSGLYDSVSIDEYAIITLPEDRSTVIDIPGGISTFALPFNIANNTISSIFDGNPPRYIFAWDNATSSYKIYPNVEGYDTFSSLEVGRGYFVYSDNPRQLSLTGNLLSAVNVNLGQGWNFISNSTGVDDLPILAITVNKDENSYALEDAISAGIIADGIYELQDGSWQLAKFLKLGKSYYVYASEPAEVVINAIEGSYFTSVEEDSFSGYVAGNGHMEIPITAPEGTTEIRANISGLDTSLLDLYLYDSSGALMASQQGSATFKEVIINNPDIGKWSLKINSTVTYDTSAAGNIYIDHPQYGQYVISSTHIPADERPGWSKCFYGSLGHGDKTGAEGLACEIGPNLLGLVPNPYAAIADQFVDLWQIGGSCVGPAFALAILGDAGGDDISEIWNNCWPNLLALIPLVGDSVQLSSKFVKQVDNLKTFLKTKTITVIRKQGETFNDLPNYLKILDAHNGMKRIPGSIKFTPEEMLNENAFKGGLGEKVVKRFDEQFTTAKGLMNEDIPLGDAVGVLDRRGFLKHVGGQTLGIGSYDPKTWKVSAGNIFVRRESGAIEAVGVGADEIFLHEGKLYIKEIKTLKTTSQWGEELSQSDIDDLRDIQRTFDTEFPQKKAEVIVQSVRVSPPDDIMQALQTAGIRLIKMD